MSRFEGAFAKHTDKQKIARETKERLKTHQKKTTDRQKHSDR